MTKPFANPQLDRLDDMDLERIGGSNSSLLDAVDKLIDKGALLKGELLLSIADVDLVKLDLSLLLAAMETLDQSVVRHEKERHIGENVAARMTSVAKHIAASEKLEPTERRPAFRVEEAPAARAPVPPARETSKGSSAGTSTSTTEEKKPGRVALDPKNAERSVAKLVLTLVEFVRRLLERQAIRRMEGGLIPEEAVERMGETLARLEEKVDELKEAFGLAGQDLDIDLGPLGRLNGPKDTTT